MGILVHEMCAGVAPYTSHREAGEGRQLEIYEQIISTKLICPDYFSLELVDLVTRLLSRYEENRLGVEGSCQGALLVHGDSLEHGYDEEEGSSLCTWGQESGLDQRR